MKCIERGVKLCCSCMEEHVVTTVEFEEKMTYKNEKIEVIVRCDYCWNLNEFVEDEEMMRLNSSRMKEAYQVKMNLKKQKEGKL